MSESDEHTAQAEKATEIALAVISQTDPGPSLGRLESWRVTEAPEGTFLEIVFRSARHHERTVRYSRIVWPAVPDKDPETSGMIFGTAFKERLRTGRARDLDPSTGADLVL